MAANDTYEARRRSRQREIKRRRRKKFFVFLLFLTLVTAVILCLTVFFRIKTVNAAGSKIYNEKQIVSAAKITDKNMFLLSAKNLTEKIRAKLPFVDSVVIKRSLPDKITLKITDAVPELYYVNNNKFYTVSKNGYVLEELSAEPQGLTKIVCSDVVCKAGKKVTVVSSREESLIEDIRASLRENDISADMIDVSNPAAIMLSVEKRFEVNMGTSAYISKKTGHLKGMINSIEADKTGTIDLSMWTPENSQGSFMKN